MADSLAVSIRALGQHYGPPTSLAPKGPFQLLLWEYVAYLADDAVRAAAFQTLKRRVGLLPRQIAGAPLITLTAVARLGGSIGVSQRVGRMKDAAATVQNDWGGNLRGLLRLPYPEARRALMTFPSIGPPGADKILLLTGTRPILALDSNALRVLLRLGYGRQSRNYAAAYAGAQRSAMGSLRRSIPVLRAAFLLLHRHGKELCRRTAPRCPVCPLRSRCAFAAGSGRGS